MGALLASLQETSRTIRELIRANEARVDATMANFERFCETLATELPVLSAQMERLVRRVDGVVAENRFTLRSSLTNLEQVTGRMQESVDNLKPSPVAWPRVRAAWASC